MDLRREYYNRMLDIFMSCYGNIIENASDGHCMKVTGFPLEVLPELRNKINSRETQAECYILSETLSGSEYITPTKLIELRNDLTKPILILIPVNSSTSAEDSYGNATFQDLSVKTLDFMLFKSLLNETDGNKTIKTVLQYAEKNLNVSVNDKINYLLYVVLSGLTDKEIGNGIFYLGLIPDEKLAQRKEYTPSFLMINVMIVNEAINNYPQKVQVVRNDTGEQIYQSNAIPVGSKIERAKLDVALPAGTYECTAYFHNLDPDTGEIIGTAGAIINITIKN